MICTDCGCEKWDPTDGCVSVTHPTDGSCIKRIIMECGNDALTLEEFRALIRVARAQLELEKRRGLNQK
jgi:hypothetical protein